jgi:hypothetical protein
MGVSSLCCRDPAAQLPNRYRARIGERVILEAVERSIIPDLTVVQRPTLPDRVQTPGRPARHGVRGGCADDLLSLPG